MAAVAPRSAEDPFRCTVRGARAGPSRRRSRRRWMSVTAEWPPACLGRPSVRARTDIPLPPSSYRAPAVGDLHPCVVFAPLRPHRIARTSPIGGEGGGPRQTGLSPLDYAPRQRHRVEWAEIGRGPSDTGEAPPTGVVGMWWSVADVGGCHRWSGSLLSPTNSAPVTLVADAAGWGKTLRAASWLEAGAADSEAAWGSLDKNDDVSEVRAADLAIGPDEAAELVPAHGAGADGAALSRLHPAER